MTDDPHSAPSINKLSYSAKKIARYWSCYNPNLLYGEKRILDGLVESLKGSRFLDVGVGGGRTTPHIAPIVKDYIGIDYSPVLIDFCKKSFPGHSFFLHDASSLESLGKGSFDFVFFSFNGIDCLSGEQRAAFIRSAWNVLSPGGFLLFSSHNYFAANLRISRTKVIARDLRASLCGSIISPRHLYHLVLRIVNYLRNYRYQLIDRDIAFLLDGAQGYREVLAWVKPERQIEDVRLAGFVVERVYNWQGEPLEAKDFSSPRVPSVYYLCRKP